MVAVEARAAHHVSGQSATAIRGQACGGAVENVDGTDVVVFTHRAHREVVVLVVVETAGDEGPAEPVVGFADSAGVLLAEGQCGPGVQRARLALVDVDRARVERAEVVAVGVTDGQIVKAVVVEITGGQRVAETPVVIHDVEVEVHAPDVRQSPRIAVVDHHVAYLAAGYAVGIRGSTGGQIGKAVTVEITEGQGRPGSLTGLQVAGAFPLLSDQGKMRRGVAEVRQTDSVQQHAVQ